MHEAERPNAFRLDWGGALSTLRERKSERIVIMTQCPAER